MQRREALSWLGLAAILSAFAAFAWLTRNPEARILEQAQEWPGVGNLARAFRRSYLPAAPLPPQPVQQIEVVSPREPEIGRSRSVRAQPGAGRQTGPDADSPVVGGLELKADREPVAEISRRTDPVLPLAAASPDPERIAWAQKLMGTDHQRRECGAYEVHTDAPDDPLWLSCEQLTASLEAIYQVRYGVEPAGPTAGAILLFRGDSEYGAFRAGDGVRFATGAAHARPARGYVALARGNRSTPEVQSSLVHEISHLLNRRFLGPALPAWLDEGIADDLADSRIGRDGSIDPALLGGETISDGSAVRRRGGQAAALLLQRSARAGRLPTLPDLLSMEAEEFFRRGDAELHYALSSFWIRYLASGFDAKLRSGLRRFLADVAAGVPLAPDLLWQCLESEPEALEADFRVWLHLQFVRPPREEPEASS